MNHKDIISLFLPYGLVMLIRAYKRFLGGHSLFSYRKYRQMTRSNKRFRNLHIGERCFVLANGPSTRNQDLSQLREELVFTVSRGYLHKDYSTIKPKFHVIQPMPASVWSEKASVNYLARMHENLHEVKLHQPGLRLRFHSSFP